MRHRIIITGDKFGKIKIINVDDGSLIKTLDCNRGNVISLDISSDNTKLVSGSGYEDPLIRLWDVEKNQELWSIKIDDDNIWSVKFIQNYTKIVLGGSDGAYIWDIVTGSLIHKLENRVIYAVVTLSNDLIATAGKKKLDENTNIKIWQDNTLIKSFDDNNRILCMIFDNTNDLLAAGNDKGEIRIWNFHTGSLIITLKGSTTDQIYCMTFLDDEKIICGSDKCQLLMWNYQSGQLLNNNFVHSEYIRDMVYFPFRQELVIAGIESKIYIWNVKNYQLLKTINNENMIYSVCRMSNTKIDQRMRDYNKSIY